MSENALQYTKARFWKCALQVNPAGYIAYRGEDHGLTEDQYNQELLRVAKENEISVIGLADHGNVEGMDAIRTLMNTNGIIVFPGFEISSTEKAHFVCLYPEETTTAELNRYLGNLDLLDPEDGVRPSRLGAEELLKRVVDDQNGFAYAAHATDDNGLLFRRLNHVWKSPFLKAAQIPGTLDDLRNNVGNAHRLILLNKTPEYEREAPVAIVNAKDVARPEDLANPKASCLIKMTRPGFESLRLAFQDPESRVRLCSDLSEQYYSRIERLTVTGGYLDGLHVDFSEHLNAVIGGRGTGKSTLLECIRFVLGIEPIGENARKQHKGIIAENIARSKARVEVTIRSSRMNGRRFVVARRYGEDASITDKDGNPSSFGTRDILPEIEIYGQNEIYEIAQDHSNQRQLLQRFLKTEEDDSVRQISEKLDELARNRESLLEAEEKVAEVEDEVASLPKLEEQLEQFNRLGLGEKLKIVPLLATERELWQRVQNQEINALNTAFEAIRNALPEIDFLKDERIANLPHVEIFRNMRKELKSLSKDAQSLLEQWTKKFTESKQALEKRKEELESAIKEEESLLEKTFEELPECEGKSGQEIGIEYQRLAQELERIRPQKNVIQGRKEVVVRLRNQRKSILHELSKLRANRSAHFERLVKRLNRRLQGKLRLTVQPEADRTPVQTFLLNCNLANVGQARLDWINDADDFSPVRFAELIRGGTEALQGAGWALTPTVAEALTRLTSEQMLQLDEIELPDLIDIELNIAHEGIENFKPLSKLSTGQQCTAILHLLLLDNLDPLIMDQPEDNLDNAFIADRIVTELRYAKIVRQFIFATHNANIPVFGDAEWIGVLEASEDQAEMPADSQGAIDVPNIRDLAANLLEGGKTAFNQRKDKYGF